MSRSLAARFWSKVQITDFLDCWIWTASTNHLGYGRFGVNGKNRYAHRIAWQLAYGEIPLGICVCHKCDNPICVNPGHFFLGTKHENFIDMARKGRHANKLTNDQVLSIRSVHKKGLSCQHLARFYQVDYSHITRIVNNQRRQHIL